MPKRDDSRPSSKSKMLVMVFQLEGDDQTIQEGLRRVGEAVRGAVGNTPKQVLKINGSSAADARSSEAEADGQAEEEGEPQEPGSDDSAAEQYNARAPKREEREKPPQVLTTINFKGASMSLDEFATTKKVGESAARRTLVAAMWLRDYADVKEFSADHIYTCFRWMKWTNVPDRPRKALRNFKSGQSYFDSGSKPGLYSLSLIGEKAVEQSLKE